MIRRHAFTVSLLCAFAIVSATRARAHLDEMAQVLTPDPLVLTFEAEALAKGGGPVEVVDDASARGGKAAVLRGEGAGFEMDLGELSVGMYSVWVAGKVTDPRAIENSIDLKKLAADNQQTRPLYLELQVNSGNDGSIQKHRLRVPFSKQRVYEYITRIYFHAPQQRRYTAKLALSRGTMVDGVTIDFIDLRNPLGELTFQPIKQKRTLVDAREIPGMRVSAAKEGKLPEPIRAQPLTAAQRLELDDRIWRDSIMPLNANPGQIYGAVRPPEELAAVVQREEAKLGVKLGAWQTGRHESYEDAWTIENKALSKVYTRGDYEAGRTLPEPWPFPEDTGGFFFEKERWQLAAPFNGGVIPAAIQQRYHVVLGALGATPQSQITPNRFDLPSRYLLLGDLEAAADASFLLAAYAYHYPAYDWNIHCLDNVVMVSRTFTPGNVRGRGCSYQGWSTPEIQGVLRAYDSLFPYIQGNQALADRLHRFIPWVQSPDDVVKLIDTFLVQRAALDGVRQILYVPIVPTAATVLGPSEVADHYLDLYVYSGKVYQRDNRSAFADNIINSYSRDGMNYIGSTYYVVGESVGEMMEASTALSRYVASGGNKRFDLADPVRFPGQAALPDALLGLHTAGGHRIGVGDVHGPNAVYMPWQHVLKDDTLNVFEKGWFASKDPRYAWILANRRGQGQIADKAWAEIQASAKLSRDPLLYGSSRVLEGFGVARLEENVEAADMRLKQSMVMRFGVASGHAHPDTLDIELYAHGTRATSDLGGRLSGQYGRPTCMSTFVHNVVQVDDGNFNNGPQNSTAHGWLTAYKPTPMAQYVAGAARADAQPQVSEYRRGVLQVMVDGGDAEHPARGYLFDVFRVAGGKAHTWCFHGSVSDEFGSSIDLQPAASDLAKTYLAKHQEETKLEGVASDVLEATWRLRRTEESLHGVELKNAEKEMLGSLYDESSPRKFTRVRLFGHGGEKAMVGNWYSTTARKLSYPFLYVRREGQENLTSVYPALVEPFAGEPIVQDAKRLNVEGGAVALSVTTAERQRDLLFASPQRGREHTIDGGAIASGDVALVSRDEKGLRLLTLVGGSRLEDGDVRIAVQQAERRATVQAISPAQFRLTVDADLPAGVLDGQALTIGNDRHVDAFVAKKVAGKVVDLDRSTRVYRGAAAYIDPNGAYVQLDAPPSLASYHPTYYHGMTAVNEAGKVVGKVQVELGDRFWYTGWPEVRKHAARMDSADLTDANGDGKVTLAMFVNPANGEPARKLGPDGETLVEVPAGEKMLDLEVSRVENDGYLLYTKQHPREYVDALKVPHPGWPYHQQIVRNERGDKQWVLNMPGDTYRLGFGERKVSAADFPDTNGDGRAVVELYAVGPGDTLVAPTHVYLRRTADRVFELRADVGCSITIAGKSFTVDEGQLAAGPMTLRLD